jgi:hypothetical protein
VSWWVVSCIDESCCELSIDEAPVTCVLLSTVLIVLADDAVGSSRRRPVAGHRLLQAGDCITVAAHGHTRRSGRGHRLQLRRSHVGGPGIRESLVRIGDNKGMRVILVAEQVEDEIDQLDHGTPLARRMDGSRLALGR